MTRPVDGDVRISSDLAVEVDGRPVAVTADGDHVVIRIADPAYVLTALTSTVTPVGAPRVATRSSVRRIAEGLAHHGVTVTVEGPEGQLAAVGADATGGRWTRRALGTGHARLGSWSAVGPVVRPVLVSAVRRGLQSLRARATRR